MVITKDPELRDEVKNKKNDTTGIVIAKYNDPVDNIKVLDVRAPNEHVYYGSPMTNWEVTKPCDE